MKKILLFFLICCQFSYGYSAVGIVVKGTVTDKNGGTLPYVTLSTDKNHLMEDSLAITDANGAFELHLKEANDSCKITFSYIGYKTKIYTVCPLSNMDMGRIVMQEDTIVLHEVVVNANLQLREHEKTLYFPTIQQRKAANTGAKLLYNMMIPELKVNRISGTASTVDGKAVTLLINGVEASVEEIKSIRSKDVIRVDFYPIPSGKFSQYEAVADFVVKKFDSGGYAKLNTSTDFLEPKGSYDINVSYHKNRWDYYTVIGYGLSKNTKETTDLEEQIELSPAFIRHSYTDSFTKKNNNAYGIFKARYEYKNVYLNISCGLRWSRMPEYLSKGIVDYSHDANIDSNDSLSRNSRSFSPYINAHFQWTIDKRNFLLVKAGYSHADNSSYRFYTETSYSKPIVSNTNEHNNAYTIETSYFHDFNDGSELAVGYKYSDSHYNDVYSGTTDAKQCFTSRLNDMWAKFQHSFSKKFYGFLRLSVLNTNTIINGDDTNEWSFRPQISLSYRFDETSKLTFDNKIEVQEPSVQDRSSIQQSVNEYEIKRGNENLSNIIGFWPTLTYTKSFGIFDSYFNLTGCLYPHSIQDNYFIENNKLIHSYKQGKFYYLYGSNIGGTLNLLDSNLQIGTQLCYQIAKSNDDYGRSLNCLFWGGNVLYTVGNMSVNLYYQSGGKDPQFDSSIYTIEPSEYGLDVSYSKGGFYASLGFSNIFTKNAKSKYCLNSKVYNKTSIECNRDYRPYISLELSYNFDFGHKKIKKEDVEVDKVVNNGILEIK